MVFETIWGVVSLRGVRSLLGGVGGDGGGDEEDGDEDDNDPWAVSRTVWGKGSWQASDSNWFKGQTIMRIIDDRLEGIMLDSSSVLVSRAMKFRV